MSLLRNVTFHHIMIYEGRRHAPNKNKNKKQKEKKKKMIKKKK